MTPQSETAPDREWLRKYREYLSRNGLKSTVQRDLIVAEFFKAREHVSAEELHARLRTEHSSIGLATVYRAMNMLIAAGLAHERRFKDGVTRFEPAKTAERHHDHMVCVSCGAVEEFENESIEKLQAGEAKKRGFKMLDHRLEIYGLCKACAGVED
ncbi:MAG: Fur family transcriptional regulator [Candidatus Nitrospinota bacterium M3_3B_026]